MHIKVVKCKVIKILELQISALKLASAKVLTKEVNCNNALKRSQFQKCKMVSKIKVNTKDIYGESPYGIIKTLTAEIK